MFSQNSSLITEAYKFSVAPMLDCTDKHFRVLMRQISKRALLYTEMVVAQALHHNDNKKKFLDFESIEHPISLQVGGDNPKLLSEAAELAQIWGYDEINLNIGCPSQKVQSGNFGACLMAQPEKVAECVKAMTQASDLPVTVKHRIGIDNEEGELFLINFVDKVSEAGAQRFSIHARKAWLKGVNPKENRTVPPLEYEVVSKLKEDRPNLLIELNGGLNTLNDCLAALKQFDGVMVGRAAYKNPLLWKEVDAIIYKEKPKEINAYKVLKGMIPYVERHLYMGGRLWDITKHTVNLVQNVPGAKSWRHKITQESQRKDAGIDIYLKAIDLLKF